MEAASLIDDCNRVSLAAIAANRFRAVRRVLVSQGITGVLKAFINYSSYTLREKWRFTYCELALDEPRYSLPEMDPSYAIRIADRADISKIQSDMFPFLTAKEESDRLAISEIGELGVQCFIVEKNRQIVNYFFVYENAVNSPLTRTPLYKKHILETDAYFGPAFTVPHARGAWIMPQVILKILDFLEKETDATRVLLLVHEDTVGALAFYRRLGFKKIDDAAPLSFISSLTKGCC